MKNKTYWNNKNICKSVRDSDVYSAGDFFDEGTQKELVSMLKSRGTDLIALMQDADKRRQEQVGDTVTFIRNQNINFSNICYMGCKFCAFSAKQNESHAYRLSDEQLANMVAQARERKVSEITTTAGIDPNADLETYTRVLGILNSNAIHLHAFSPFEIHYLARKEKLDYQEILGELQRAGMDSLCGTAAEILVDDIRKILNPNKVSVQEWVDIVGMAHQMGIKSTATIMYGHIETVEDQARHLQIIRGLQEQTGGFTEFIPLPFIHENTEIYRSGLARAGSTGMEDLAMLSTSRLYLGDVLPNLQSTWVKTGTKFAGMALLAGVNDLGGTLYEERISSSAGGQHGSFLSEKEFVRIAQDANRPAARRDTLYNIIERFPLE